MKVLNLANVAGLNRGGGVHEVAYNYWSYQNKLDIQSHLWFPGSSNEKENLNIPADLKELMQPLPTYFHPDYGTVKNLSNLIHSLSNFDVIHQHGIWLPISNLAQKAGSKYKIPIIIQPHGYLEPYALQMSKFKKRISYYLFEKKNLELCRLLVACSDKERISLEKLFPNKDIAVIPNGIPKDFIEQSVFSDYFAHNRFHGKQNLLFFSRIHPSKGLSRLITIFSKLDKNISKNWNLIVAGIGEENYIGELRNLAANLNISDVVFFEGAKFGQEKIDILSSADLFILPTFSENFGIVIAESLSRGVPAITTQAAPCKILEDNKCGFWVNDDNVGIKMGLEQAMQLSQLELKNMGERGKKLVNETFVWENIIKQTVDLYKWVIDGGDIPAFIYKGNKSSHKTIIFK